MDINKYTTPISNTVLPLLESIVPIESNKTRDDKLVELLYEYDHINDRYSTKALLLEEQILSLGWIPGIPYNIESKFRAGLLEGSSTKIDIIDVRDKAFDGIEEQPKKRRNRFYPIYIVLVEGESLFSAGIKLITNGPFSHAAISLDDTFKSLYSYNISNSVGKLGGFSIESIYNYPKESKVGIFGMFVKKKDFDIIKKTLDKYKAHMKDTTYSFISIPGLIVGKGLKTTDFNMICSQFVDTILKSTGINIVDKKSESVVPNDFYRSYEKNSKIYKLYEGFIKNFSNKIVLDKMKGCKKEFIKECALLENEFPVQFSKEGDLIIHNRKKLNYGEEISNSNRLLKIYYKSDNLEGMKYELCKLYFIINLINEDLSKSSKDHDKLMNDRAIAVNIMTTYLKLLSDYEKSFNFEEYYNSTPFGDNTTTIKGSTIKYSLQYLKDIISAF